MAKKYIGVDIGSSFFRIYEQGRGTTVIEPAVAAVSTNNKGEYVACGKQAYVMAKKRPGAVRLVRPVMGGAVADYGIALKILTELFERVSFKSFEALVSVHAGLRDDEKSVMLDLVREAGADAAALVSAPSAAVVGAGLDISDKNCVIVCDIGGGCTEISLVSGVVGRYSKLLEYGGDSMDEAIATEIKKEYAAAISSEDAKMLREEHCMQASEDIECEPVRVRGLNMITGLPTEAGIDPGFVYDSLYEASEYISASVKYVLDKVDEDAAAQIRKRGLLLCGGASLTAGLAEDIADVSGLELMKFVKPEEFIIKGLGGMIENMEVFEVMLDFKE